MSNNRLHISIITDSLPYLKPSTVKICQLIFFEFFIIIINEQRIFDRKPTWCFVLLYYWRYKIETKSKEWALTKDVKWSEQLLMCPLLFYMRPKVFRQSVRNIIYEKDKKGKLRMRTIYSTQYQRKKRPREINLLVFCFYSHTYL